jgi:hypothetical protein
LTSKAPHYFCINRAHREDTHGARTRTRACPKCGQPRVLDPRIYHLGMIGWRVFDIADYARGVGTARSSARAAHVPIVGEGGMTTVGALLLKRGA